MSSYHPLLQMVYLWKKIGCLKFFRTRSTDSYIPGHKGGALFLHLNFFQYSSAGEYEFVFRIRTINTTNSCQKYYKFNTMKLYNYKFDNRTCSISNTNSSKMYDFVALIVNSYSKTYQFVVIRVRVLNLQLYKFIVMNLQYF